MLFPGISRRLPLLPVKPDRYRKLGLNDTSSASTLRSARPSMIVCRRVSNSFEDTAAPRDLFAIGQCLRRYQAAHGEVISLTHVALLLGLVGKPDERQGLFPELQLVRRQFVFASLLKPLVNFL